MIVSICIVRYGEICVTIIFLAALASNLQSIGKNCWRKRESVRPAFWSADPYKVARWPRFGLDFPHDVLSTNLTYRGASPIAI